MSEPRIDVVVIRDPDWETITEVYVDGKPALDAEIWDFDPGRGYEYGDYAEEAEMIAGLNIPQPIKDRLLAIHKELLPTYRRYALDSSTDWPDD